MPEQELLRLLNSAADGYRSALDLLPPDGISYAEVERGSGEIALAGTPIERKYFEFFLEGTEPAALRDDPWKIPRWGVFTAKP